MLALLLLIVGIIILIKSGEETVKNSIVFSRMVGISEAAIGFLLIAVSTSIPELGVAIVSSLDGEGLISLGNIFGSNIANISLVFGLLAIFRTIKLGKRDYKEMFKIIFITTLLSIPLLIINVWWVFGIICLYVFFHYSYVTLRENYKLEERAPEFKGIKTIEVIKSFFKFLISVSFVLLSSKLVVDSSVELIELFGVTESFIGASIIALGTSLPELAVGVSSVKRSIGLLVGNVIGSVITNTTLVLGFTVLANPIVVSEMAKVIIIFSLFVNVLFLLISRRKIGRLSGTLLFSIYLLFLLVIFSYQFFEF